jgi:hypothetical protein
MMKSRVGNANGDWGDRGGRKVKGIERRAREKRSCGWGWVRDR